MTQTTAQRMLWMPVILLYRIGKVLVLILAYGVLVILMVLNDEGNHKR